MSPRGTARALLVGAACVFGAACSQTSVVLPSRDFDRPTDMTFACLGMEDTGGGKLKPFGQPMGKCHPAGVKDDSPATVDTTNQSKYRTYAFVPNAERGDLSVIDMSYCRSAETCWPPGATIVDLDSMAVGFGAAPLGELPEVVAASQDGCRVISANRGSCDLTLVNPAVLLGRHGLAESMRVNDPMDKRPFSQTVVPRTATGRLAVAPSEVYFLPQQTNGQDGQTNLCDPGGREGTLAAPVGAPAVTDTKAPAGWRAVVTFPSCDLVALIDLPSGDILDSVQVSLTSRMENSATIPEYAFRHMGRNPICPVADCGEGAPGGGQGGAGEGTGGAGGAAGGAGGSAGQGDQGGQGVGGQGIGGAAGGVAMAPAPAVPASALRVGALAVHPEGKRIYFGATNSPIIAALDIGGAADQFVVPAAGASTELHDGARGVMRMRLSVDPYDYSKGHDAGDATRAEYGRFVAASHDDQPADPLEFLYAIAKDGTVRVVHVGRPVPAECDLWIDPSDPKAGAVGREFDEMNHEKPYPRPACFPYGAADGPRRLLFAGGPGIRLGGTPQDVAFANWRTPDRGTGPGQEAQETLDEQTLNGAFAFLMTTTGSIQILNIDPELRTPFERLRMNPSDAHTVGLRLSEQPRPLTNSVRDANVITYSTSLGAGSGPPRLDTDPTEPVDAPHLMKFRTDETRVDAHNVLTGEDKGESQYQRDTYVYFPNRATVNAQTWTIQWEGDLTSRTTGDIVTPQGVNDAPSFITSISDNGAGFCGVGVDGDVMTLVGCISDDECYPGNVCVHSARVPTSVDGRAIQGMCLRQSEVATKRDRCQPMMETFRRYEIVRNTPQTAIVVPKRVEVARPVYTNAKGQRAACEPDTNFSSKSQVPYSCQPEASTVHSKFACLQVTARPDGTPLVAPDPMASPPVLGDVSFRCFQPCTVDSDCQQGRACLPYPGMTETTMGKVVEKVCAEATPIDKDCGLDQLVRYRIGAGNAFIVAGGATGRTERVRTRAGANGPECVPDFTTSPTVIARIPTNTPECGAASVPSVGTTAETAGKFVWDSAFLSRTAGPNPNPCVVYTKPDGAPATFAQCAGVPIADRPQCTATILFQNNELRFVLTDLQRPFSESTQIRFDVRGGIAPQVVSTSSDASPGLPGRILLGPVPWPEQTDTGLTATCLGMPDKCMPGRGSDLPYMYVVDQRALVGTRVGVRGQILRITPRVLDSTAPIPGYESFANGGRYFPIQ